MSQIVVIRQSFDPAKVMAALDAIPTLTPEPFGTYVRTKYTLSILSDGLRLEVPDDVDLAAVRAAVRAAVLAHDPTPTPPPVDPDRQFFQALGTNPTHAQLVTMLRMWLRAKSRVE